MKNNATLLIDGDIVVYRAGFAADQTLYEVYVGDETAIPAFSSSVMKEVRAWLSQNEIDEYEISRSPLQKDISASLAGARDIIQNLYQKFHPKDVKLFIDGDRNFREDIATFAKYKGNRDKSRKPQHYNEIREYLVEYYNAQCIEDHETDDELGLYQDKDTIICSIDKDLRQIPGYLYNWVRDELVHISNAEAERTLYRQVLTGDKSDNIIGIAGVGDKTADKILGHEPEYFWDNVVQAYNTRFVRKLPEGMSLEEDGHLVYPHWKTGDTVYKTPEEYAVEVANLVFIKRKGQEEWQKPLTIQ